MPKKIKTPVKKTEIKKKLTKTAVKKASVAAKKPKAPSKKRIMVHATTIKTPKQKWEKRLVYFFVLVILLCSGLILYKTSPTFRNNFNGFASVMRTWNEIAWDNVDEFKMIIDNDSKEENTIIKANIITCDECQTEDIEKRFEGEFEREIYFSTYDSQSDEGKRLIKKYEIKSVPMIVFDENIRNAPFFEKYGDLMENKNESYLLYGPPVLFVKPPDHAGSYYKGEGDEIIVYGYFSFSDPHSKMAASGLDKVVKETPNSKAYFKHFIRIEEDLLPANAVECAGSQGIFWQVHNRLYENQNEFSSVDDVLNLVKGIEGLDREKLKSCINDRIYLAKIERDTAEAEEYGIDSAPAFIINGKERRNIYTYEDFAEVFNKILSKHKITDDSPVWGNPSSKIIIVEYSDFQCPFSAKYASEILPQLKEKYADSVYYAKKDFPLEELYKNSKMAAQAARCADKQNRYWQMYSDLYENQAAWYTSNDPKEIFVELAKGEENDLTFSENLYRACLEDSNITTLVESDFKVGKRIGVQATPTIYIQSPGGEQKIEGLLSFKDFERLLDKVIEENK